MMDRINAIMFEAKHFWSEHKKVVIAFGIILVIAILM
tara:strand:- start:2696 stop:2806 length:111 start_codon:yes stop_codon:yes gene_type:complete